MASVRWFSPAPSLLAALLLFSGLAGCLGDDPAPAPPAPPEALTFFSVPDTVLIINATEDGVGFDFVVAAGNATDCGPVDASGAALPMRSFVHLYDVSGLAAAVEYAPPASGESRVRIDLVGSGPWLFAGHLDPCANADLSYVSNITSGYQPTGIQFSVDGRGTKTNTFDRYEVVVATVAPASQSGQAAWVPDEWTYGIFNVYEDADYTEGSMISDRAFTDPDGGELFFEGCATPVVDCGNRRGAFRFVPGEHVWSVETPVPTPFELKRGLQVGHFHLNITLCPLGFAWSICGGGGDLEMPELPIPTTTGPPPPTGPPPTTTPTSASPTSTTSPPPTTAPAPAPQPSRRGA